MTDLDKVNPATVQWRLDVTNWTKILDEVKRLNSYYIAGGLFVDLPEGVFGFHLDGTIVEFCTGISKRMTDEQHRKVFKIYKEHKGETTFFKENIHLCPVGV